MNYIMKLSYDGTRYDGWQKQGNTQNTIQYKLETLLCRITGEEIEIAGSGRTDKGVHAKIQTCSFKSDINKPIELFFSEINKYLPEDICVHSLEYAEPRFHARLSCKNKTYQYFIWNSPKNNIFKRRYVYQYDKKLDLDKMRTAAGQLIGKHDFVAFSSVKKKKNTVRTIFAIDITEQFPEISIKICGDGFLYNMVRIIVGTLIDVGSGKIGPLEVAEILKKGDRANAGFTAPAKGLFLWSQEY